MNETKRAIMKWLNDNVDFAFFLAAFTETPRWTVAFMAINEPMWVGVPLGVLLSFATARAWRRFFESRDWRLFAFNVASMVIAVAVIAPVLRAMTEVQAHDVDLSKILPEGWLWAWSIVLALTTFIPLVQLAAVQDIPVQIEQSPSKRVTKTVRVTRTDEQSEQYTLVQPEQLPVQIVPPEQTTAIVQLDTDEQKREYLRQMIARGERFNKTKLATEWQIGRTTLYGWIAELQAN